jgi:hypothetical protein
MSSRLFAEEQIKRVAARFPDLKVKMGGPWLVIWEGPIRSFSREYLVRIFWHRWWPGKEFSVPNTKPQVFVLDPPLLDRTDQRIPHLYRRDTPPKICAWDPLTDDWDSTQAIADTIIPFIIQWLCSYELWRASGDWPAPGRHPEVPCEKKSNSSSLGQPARCMAAEFVRIGRLTGTFASLALMAVASEGSSRWPSLLDWSRDTFEADQSPNISILSLAPPPGELLLSA